VNSLSLPFPAESETVAKSHFRRTYEKDFVHLRIGGIDWRHCNFRDRSDSATHTNARGPTCGDAGAWPETHAYSGCGEYACAAKQDCFN
jgi:hypothetical protein